MRASPDTRASLLVRIRDGRDAEAWSQFVEMYGPLIYDYGRRGGFQDADAADLAQEVLQAVAGAAGRFEYDPARGSFRSWLFTVARTKRLDLAARLARHPRGSGRSSVMEQLGELAGPRDGEAEEAEWRLACEQRLVDLAAEQIRGEFREPTWQAFWQTFVEHAAPQEVASRLGMTIGAVYAARCRVLARLRERVRQLRDDDDHP
ncbi:RNA polymerase sigma factor [Aquisphaera insulae]|uniref:RNA polymerase sigma factor n=1 Tax=Aquisphaera insulae TaxID=2712864 RepID=UPI0013EC9BA0|nr:sigma-70 family RNA polymerase sigma factor [Aquisphaera insulae]